MADLLSGCCHVVASSSLCSAPDALATRGVCLITLTHDAVPAACTVESSRRSSNYRDFQIGGQSNRSDEVICRFHIQGTAVEQFAIFFDILF